MEKHGQLGKDSHYLPWEIPNQLDWGGAPVPAVCKTSSCNSHDSQNPSAFCPQLLGSKGPWSCLQLPHLPRPSWTLVYLNSHVRLRSYYPHFTEEETEAGVEVHDWPIRHLAPPDIPKPRGRTPNPQHPGWHLTAGTQAHAHQKSIQFTDPGAAACSHLLPTPPQGPLRPPQPLQSLPLPQHVMESPGKIWLWAQGDPGWISGCATPQLSRQAPQSC